MEKSGTGDTVSAKRPLRKEAPLRFAAEVIATTAFWGLWFYVIAPLITLVLWLAGVHVFVEQMIVLGGYEFFLENFTNYGLVVLGIMLTIFAWVVWNQRRYGVRNTRIHGQPPVSLGEIATKAGLDPRTIRILRVQRRVVVGFDEQNRLLVMNKGEVAYRNERHAGTRR